MNAWKRLSLAYQFATIIILIVAIMFVLSMTLARDVNVSATLNEARTVTDMVENVGAWSSQYKGAWIRKDANDTKTVVGDFLNQEFGASSQAPKPHDAGSADSATETTAPATPAVTFHQKNPALIQRELSQVTEKSNAKAKFRMTSDKFMNPDNAPNRFELTALDAIRAAPNQKEYYETTDTELNYARGITASVSCLKCHDTPEKAPAAVREKYPSLRGYGYKAGEVIGVISVKVPLDGTAKNLIDNLSVRTWIIISIFIAALIVMFSMIRRSMISPLRRLRKFADDVRDAGPETPVVAPVFVKNEYTSKNEIHQLSQALKALQAAIKIFNS